MKTKINTTINSTKHIDTFVSVCVCVRTVCETQNNRRDEQCDSCRPDRFVCSTIPKFVSQQTLTNKLFVVGNEKQVVEEQ